MRYRPCRKPREPARRPPWPSSPLSQAFSGTAAVSWPCGEHHLPSCAIRVAPGPPHKSTAAKTTPNGAALLNSVVFRTAALR